MGTSGTPSRMNLEPCHFNEKFPRNFNFKPFSFIHRLQFQARDKLPYRYKNSASFRTRREKVSKEVLDEIRSDLREMTSECESAVQENYV